MQAINNSKMERRILFFIATLTLFLQCEPKKTASEETTKSPFQLSEEHFGITEEGDSVTLYTFANDNGLEVRIMNYGGVVTHLNVPDKNGVVEDVVLGFDKFEDYLAGSPYFGAIVGRYGNRIAGGKFELNGMEYNLAINNGQNHLHGGLVGFDKVIWEAEAFQRQESAGLILKYLSKDMEEGYPGNLDVTVTYTIEKNNEIRIDYYATTDKSTIVNLTQHTYFNLTGNAKSDILNHEVSIKADSIVPVDAGLIPTGVLMPVEGTPFDFREINKVGARIDEKHEQLQLGGGYDHCWVLDKSSGDALEWVIRAQDPESGRVLEVATSEPGVQFYTGNFLNGTLTGKNNVVYDRRYGLCFEPQHYPDSPNQPNFPSVILNPGEEYKTTTIWKFDVLD
jgi:aldose 1-epimerase